MQAMDARQSTVAKGKSSQHFITRTKQKHNTRGIDDILLVQKHNISPEMQHDIAIPCTFKYSSQLRLPAKKSSDIDLM